MNFGAVPVATIWLQNFNQITVSVKMHGINAQRAYYKCILLLPVKYLSWSGNEISCQRTKQNSQETKQQNLEEEIL